MVEISIINDDRVPKLHPKKGVQDIWVRTYKISGLASTEEKATACFELLSGFTDSPGGQFGTISKALDVGAKISVMLTIPDAKAGLFLSCVEEHNLLEKEGMDKLRAAIG